MKESTFSSYKKNIPLELESFKPFASSSDRKFWQNISAEIKTEILHQAELAAEKIKTEGWPLLNMSLWHDFYKNGNRVNFENNYFNRRNILTILVLSECMENSGKYLEAITDGIFMICEESGWQLPAHNSYIRDTPQLPYPNSSKPIFDLFAGETANLLSLTYLLLKNQLDKDSPLICERIMNELNFRIIQPYLNEHFWWMGNEDEPMCNWTPWCTQNVLLTSFILPFSQEVRHKVLEKSLYSLDCFVKDYGHDGCCNEGAEYYRHAGLTFYNAIEIINSVTGGLLKEVYSLEKIKNIAEYILNMNIPHSEYFFNFADCSPKAGKSGAREFLFGKAVHSALLCNFAAEQWAASSVEEKIFSLSAGKLSQSNLYYILQSVFADKEIDAYKKEKALSLQEENGSLQDRVIYYESTGVFIVHSGIYSVASKAGSNADSHNHNDTGSFIIYKNGQPFIIDVGVENYTQKTFSPERYEIWTMQSAYHNLPTLNNVMQKDGREFRAENTGISGKTISMNIEKAYPAESQIEFYRRKISTEKTGVTVTDNFKFRGNKKQTVLSLMMSRKFEYSKEKNALVCKTETAEDLIKFTSGNSVKSVKVEEIQINDSRLQKTWKEKIYRALIEVQDTQQFEMIFE